MSFFIAINTSDDTLLELHQNIGHIFKLRNRKGRISYRKKKKEKSTWPLVAMSAEMLIALLFWHDEFTHFPGRARKYIVKI